MMIFFIIRTGASTIESAEALYKFTDKKYQIVQQRREFLNAWNLWAPRYPSLMKSQAQTHLEPTHCLLSTQAHAEPSL